MPFYVVRYAVSKKHEYVYPRSIANVVWKLAVYHYKERVMIGETDSRVKADGKEVVSVERKEAQRLIGQFRASYPRIEGSPPGVSLEE